MSILAVARTEILANEQTEAIPRGFQTDQCTDAARAAQVQLLHV